MSTPKPRESVARIPAYVPGKPPTPRPGQASYKLSSNENPYPPLPGVLEAAADAAAQLNRYPDMGASVLYDRLAEHLDTLVENLALATGSVAVLYHLLQAFCDPGDEVVYAWRSFEAYPIAVAACGATGVQVPLTTDARHDLDAMADAITERTKLVIVCTPNNPTGPAVTQAELDAFLARVPEDVLVVVDEAYLEFVVMEDAVDGLATLARHDNVVLTRTFSKAYGLAGLRVGYAVARPAIAAAVRAVSLPFGVSAIAQAAAIASLDRFDELTERVRRLALDRDALLVTLRALGWRVPDAQGNFVWIGADQIDPQELAARAGEEGLSVRPFPEGVRVSIGEPAANEAFARLAESLLTDRS